MKKFIITIFALTLALSMSVPAFASNAEPSSTPEAAPEITEPAAEAEPAVTDEEAAQEPLEETENPQDTEAADGSAIIDPAADAKAAKTRYVIVGGVVLLLGVGLLVAANLKSKKRPQAK